MASAPTQVGSKNVGRREMQLARNVSEVETDAVTQKTVTSAGTLDLSVCGASSSVPPVVTRLHFDK